MGIAHRLVPHGYLVSGNIIEQALGDGVASRHQLTKPAISCLVGALSALRILLLALVKDGFCTIYATHGKSCLDLLTVVPKEKDIEGIF